MEAISSKTKFSKAQIEVWEWKNAIYEQIKDMPLDEGVRLILKKSKRTIERLKKKKELQKQLPL